MSLRGGLPRPPPTRLRAWLYRSQTRPPAPAPLPCRPITVKSRRSMRNLCERSGHQDPEVDGGRRLLGQTHRSTRSESKIHGKLHRTRLPADIVRLIHGDANPAGPGFKDQLIASPVSKSYRGRVQPLRKGSSPVGEEPPGASEPQEFHPPVLDLSYDPQEGPTGDHHPLVQQTGTSWIWDAHRQGGSFGGLDQGRGRQRPPGQERP